MKRLEEVDVPLVLAGLSLLEGAILGAEGGKELDAEAREIVTCHENSPVPSRQEVVELYRKLERFDDESTEGDDDKDGVTP